LRRQLRDSQGWRPSERNAPPVAISASQLIRFALGRRFPIVAAHDIIHPLKLIVRQSSDARIVPRGRCGWDKANNRNPPINCAEEHNFHCATYQTALRDFATESRLELTSSRYLL
jgi:hypothetical protein